MKIYKSVYRHILKQNTGYGNEMYEKRESWGVTKKDGMRNTHTRGALEMKLTLNFTERKQLSWWGHIQLMEELRPSKKFGNINCEEQ